MYRPRRAVHFVPGGNERMLEKSLQLPADSLVLDLEDAVTPDDKDRAREQVAGWLADAAFGGRERIVRINPLDTPWGRADIERTMEAGVDAYLVPKLRTRSDVEVIDGIVAELEGRHGRPPGGVKLLLLGTETPLGALNVDSLATFDRVDALTWGAEDLSAELGSLRNRDESGAYLEVFRYCRVRTLLAAAACGVQPLDTVYVDISDLDGLRRECLEGAWMGFTGKITIHPSQIEVVNEVFTPTSEQIEESLELVGAFEENRRQGRMAFRFRGQMVDVPHLTRAEKLLERARAAGVLSD